jgi:hypothetical protein
MEENRRSGKIIVYLGKPVLSDQKKFVLAKADCNEGGIGNVS